MDTLDSIPVKSAKRLTPEQRAARKGEKTVSVDDDKPPPRRERTVRPGSGWRWFFGLLFVIALVLLALLVISGTPRSTVAADAQPTPTASVTPRPPLPPTASPTARFPDPEYPPLSWARIRTLKHSFVWPCYKFCSGGPVVEIEQNWRTLRIQNDRIRAYDKAQTLDRDGSFMLNSGWFSWTDGNAFFVYLKYKSGHTAGTPVKACFTGRNTRNDSRVEDYAIGDVVQGNLHCVDAVLSEVFPDPLPSDPLVGAVSEGLWAWACDISQVCDRNPLTEWIVYKEREL